MTPPLRVAVIVPPEGPRQWQVDAVNRAERGGIIRVDAVIESPRRGGLVRDLLIGTIAMAERLIEAVQGKGGHRTPLLRARCHARRVWPTVEWLSSSLAAAGGAPRVWSLVINLSGGPAGPMPWLTTVGVVEFTLGNSRDLDGALQATCLERHTIEMSVRLVTALGSFEKATAVAGLRQRTLMVGSLEVLLARAATVLARGIAAASAHAAGAPASLVATTTGTPLAATTAAHLLVRALGDYARSASGRLQSGTPTWFLAFREPPVQFVADTLTSSPTGLTTIAPPRGHFHADPCVFRRHGVDHVFFEDFDRGLGRGVIAWMRRVGPGTFTAAETVLERPYHLSYPFVFAYGDDVLMVPETSEVRRVELYRATDFPRRWERVAVLLNNVQAVDATLVEHDGRWWMFAGVAEAGSSTLDELCVYYAASPFGPWFPHAANPVKSDVRSARPAGRMFRRGGRLLRPAQNCSRSYGGSVAICEVLELTPSVFRERLVTDVQPPWSGAQGFHTLAFSEGVEFLDGHYPAGQLRKGA